MNIALLNTVVALAETLRMRSMLLDEISTSASTLASTTK